MVPAAADDRQGLDFRSVRLVAHRIAVAVVLDLDARVGAAGVVRRCVREHLAGLLREVNAQARQAAVGRDAGHANTVAAPGSGNPGHGTWRGYRPCWGRPH